METKTKIHIFEILRIINIQHLSTLQSKHLLNVAYIRNNLTFEINNYSIPINSNNYKLLQQYLTKLYTATAKMHIYTKTDTYKILNTISNKMYQKYMNKIIEETAKIIVTFS